MTTGKPGNVFSMTNDFPEFREDVETRFDACIARARKAYELKQRGLRGLSVMKTVHMDDYPFESFPIENIRLEGKLGDISFPLIIGGRAIRKSWRITKKNMRSLVAQIRLHNKLAPVAIIPMKYMADMWAANKDISTYVSHIANYPRSTYNWELDQH